MAIVDAILAGERNPQRLAKLAIRTSSAMAEPSPGPWWAIIVASIYLRCASR